MLMFSITGAMKLLLYYVLLWFSLFFIICWVVTAVWSLMPASLYLCINSDWAVFLNGSLLSMWGNISFLWASSLSLLMSWNQQEQNSWPTLYQYRGIFRRFQNLKSSLDPVWSSLSLRVITWPTVMHPFAQCLGCAGLRLWCRLPDTAGEHRLWFWSLYQTNLTVSVWHQEDHSHCAFLQQKIVKEHNSPWNYKLLFTSLCLLIKQIKILECSLVSLGGIGGCIF